MDYVTPAKDLTTFLSNDIYDVIDLLSAGDHFSYQALEMLQNVFVMTRKYRGIDSA